MALSINSKFQYQGINPQLTGLVQPVEKPAENSAGIDKVQSLQPKYLGMAAYGFGENSEKIYVGNSDISLSNFRGELAVNMPLGADAQYVNGGFAGGSLNVLA